MERSEDQGDVMLPFNTSEKLLRSELVRGRRVTFAYSREEGVTVVQSREDKYKV